MRKTCTRIHFFNLDSTKDEVATLIENALIYDVAEFWEKHYLGFITIKPIPDSLIGYSLLKPYQDNKSTGSRIYWGIRSYKIHLLGREIKFNSLAFQQQDSILGACATMSIWSLFHKACLSPYINLKTSGQITNETGLISPNGHRLIPNKGLSIPQISTAIAKNGLQPEVMHIITLMTLT